MLKQQFVAVKETVPGCSEYFITFRNLKILESHRRIQEMVFQRLWILKYSGRVSSRTLLEFLAPSARDHPTSNKRLPGLYSKHIYSTNRLSTSIRHQMKHIDLSSVVALLHTYPSGKTVPSFNDCYAYNMGNY